MTRQLRKSLRTARSNLTVHEQHQHARAVTHRLMTHPWFLYARHIGFYMAMEGELNPSLLMERARQLNKHCYLPKLATGFHRHIDRAMTFLPDNGQYSVNKFGIPEPDVHLRYGIDPHMLDLVIVPLVGFDRACNRLGMGAGYYDRTFAFMLSQTAWHRPKLVGVAHALQETSGLVREPWDVPLDAIVTEHEMLLPELNPEY